MTNHNINVTLNVVTKVTYECAGFNFLQGSSYDIACLAHVFSDFGGVCVSI